MIPVFLASSLGMMAAGPAGALVGGVLVYAVPKLRRRAPVVPGVRLVLILLLVELRSGSSVLAALRAAADWLPEHADLQKVTRVATVVGIRAAIEDASPALRPVLVQLERAKRSGASLGSTVARLIDEDLAEDRASRLAKARSLPVRLMIPVTLLMLPGLVLLLYAPSLLRLFDDLTGPFS